MGKAVIIFLLLVSVIASQGAKIPGFEDFVKVPNDKSMHPSCVHLVEEEDAVVHKNEDGSGFTVSLSDGTSRFLPACKYPIMSTSVLEKLTPPSGPVSESGYTLDANHYFKCVGCPEESDPMIQSFIGQWAVPAEPKQHATQIIYLWNGIVADTGDDVLQPVLQFGTTPAGGGAFWGIASWYVGGLGAIHSTLLKVSAGDIINGSMVIDEDKTWSVLGTDLNTTKSASLKLNVNKYGEQFGIYVTLEVYTVTSCAQLPASNGCYFWDLITYNTDGDLLDNQFEKQIFYKGVCGNDVIIGSTNSTVLLKWAA